MSVSFKHGTTTGISAGRPHAHRAQPCQFNAGASDFTRPGHIFPLVAREGGVLMRSGHASTAVAAIIKLAGLPPVGVICELINDDGTVTRDPQVTAFAGRLAG